MKANNHHSQLQVVRLLSALLVCCLLAAVLAGCSKSEVDQALDSDANGYLCGKCQAKFYTDRELFPSHCPECRNPQVEMVLGFVCADDSFVTMAARGRGSAKCGKCGKTVTAISLPREADLKAWGASKKTSKEVDG